MGHLHPENSPFTLIKWGFYDLTTMLPIRNSNSKEQYFSKTSRVRTGTVHFLFRKNIFYTHKKFENIVFFTVTVPLSTFPGVAEGFQGKKWKIE